MQITFKNILLIIYIYYFFFKHMFLFKRKIYFDFLIAYYTFGMCYIYILSINISNATYINLFVILFN